MRLGKDIIGKPIITISDGRLIGKVKDLYIDKDLHWLNGVHLGREGLIRRKENLIAREDVVVFGVDAVLVQDESCVTDNKTRDINDWIRLSKLSGRDIDTPGGTKLATVGDVIFDSDGQIQGFSLGKVSVDGPIANNRAISRDVVIDNGEEDNVMTIDLIKAEQLGIPEDKIPAELAPQAPPQETEKAE